MNLSASSLVLLTLAGALAVGPALRAQAPAAQRLTPNLVGQLDRPLRYAPDGEDFVITNGAEFFNRPLYGGNTAFRADAGDRPEFVLYLPGRGGNLRLGLRSATGATWLHGAARIETRYRPGAMLYELRDPLLGPGGMLRLHVLALVETDGLIVRAEAHGLPAGLELLWAYGGANGQRGVRDGDIGTERVPIGEWFQLQPEFCRGHSFTLTDASFTLRTPFATIRGVGPPGAALALADARQWSDPAALLATTGAAGELPVVVGRVGLHSGQPVFLALQRLAPTPVAAEELETYRAAGAAPAAAPPGRALRAAYTAAELPAVFAATEAHFAALRAHVAVATPDPFLNAAVGALNVAADAVWDEPQGVVLHGAVAWRSRLLGWRGAYAMDALGWPDRARRHLAYWATRQNLAPLPAQLPPPDAASNLARSEAALHSHGDLSNSHYDMNLVYVDALFRHLFWTGDLAFAREVWPVIARHLAWEERLFRRVFTADGETLPLYEAYAAIWASDDLGYHGGGVAHATAYHYWHRRMAARLATALGLDPAPHAREADLLARGMRRLLWTGSHFAEFKDLLGLQLVHPSAGLWTFYHTMDSGLPTPAEAARMADETFARLPRLPVRGPGVPTDRPYAVHATTDWLPYTWSLNNVVMGENLHAALGLWQAGRPEEAFTLMKGALLASMFMGICPGNVGSMNYLDVYRREAQRDFADGGGVAARALLEGLFGLRPDLLAGELLLAPGLPAAWDHASLRHPGVALGFARDGATDRYTVEPRFARPLALRLRLPAAARAARVTINGQPVAPTAGDAAFAHYAHPAAGRFAIAVVWPAPAADPVTPAGEIPVATLLAPFDFAAGDPRAAARPPVYAPVPLAEVRNDRVTAIFQPGKYRAPRSPFVSLALPAQGIGAWAGHVHATAEIDDTGLRRVAGAHGGVFTLPDGVPFATPGPGTAPNIVFVSQWDNYPRAVTVPLSGRARTLHLLLAGSTNPMQSRLDNGEVVVGYADGTTERLALRNPDTWWPIEQDYFVDDYQFRMEAPLPVRVNLRTGEARVLEAAEFKGRGGVVPGGAATVLGLPLDPAKEVRTLTVRALANEVVIGLLAATLER